MSKMLTTHNKFNIIHKWIACLCQICIYTLMERVGVISALMKLEPTPIARCTSIYANTSPGANHLYWENGNNAYLAVPNTRSCGKMSQLMTKGMYSLSMLLGYDTLQKS